jgi:hypothetical protein
MVIIQHETLGARFPDSMLKLLAGFWQEWGHEIWIASGTEGLPEADIAVLHVDLSVVPQAYADAANHYPRVVNGAALDIRKRLVSSNLVTPADDWNGPVIVKTDLNYFGVPEALTSRAQASLGREPVHAPPVLDTYPIYDNLQSVPGEVWSQPSLVVERFLPEWSEEEGYSLRTWIFFGGRERCTRHLCREPIVKARNLIRAGPVPVPDFLRAERERLGFDYGKFDFVIHDGQAVLLDANKTPGPPPSSPDAMERNARLAGGIDMMLATQESSNR